MALNHPLDRPVWSALTTRLASLAMRAEHGDGAAVRLDPDIGVFAAMAFENPDGWFGREVDLAGDELTMPEIAGTFSRVTGREVDYFQVPWDQFEEQMGEEYAVMYRWFNDYGYEADIAALKKEHPGLVTFEQYLRSHGWENAGLP